MASETEDGGPAFPVAEDHRTADQFPWTQGMSLREYAAIKLRVPDSGSEWLDDMIRQAKRDWFAGQCFRDTFAALHAQGVENLNEYQIIQCAKTAYLAADAMLATRKKTRGEA